MYVFYFFALTFFLLGQDLEQIITQAICNNVQIKTLQKQIQQLELQSKIVRKWDNLIINTGFNTLDLDHPANRKDPMQSISIGLTQKIDLFAKKPLESKKVSLQKAIKILELKAFQKQIIKRIKLGMIKNYQNKYRQNILRSVIKNMEMLKAQINSSSSNSTLAKVYEIEILKTKLEIRLNEILENTKTEMITLNEVSFGDYDDVEFVMDFHTKFHSNYYQKSYELEIQKIKQRIAMEEVKLSKKSFLSDPVLGIGYFYRQDQSDFLNLSLSFSLPIYGREKLVILQARKQVQIENDQLYDRENAIKAKINRLKNIVEKKQEELKIIENNLIPQNQKLIDLYQHNLSNSTSLKDYYFALNEMLDNKLLRIDVLGAIYSAWAELESMGEVE